MGFNSGFKGLIHVRKSVMLAGNFVHTRSDYLCHLFLHLRTLSYNLSILCGPSCWFHIVSW